MVRGVTGVKPLVLKLLTADVLLTGVTVTLGCIELGNLLVILTSLLLDCGVSVLRGVTVRVLTGVLKSDCNVLLVKTVVIAELSDSIVAFRMRDLLGVPVAEVDNSVVEVGDNIADVGKTVLFIPKLELLRTNEELVRRTSEL